jgi:hypothetical protein
MRTNTSSELWFRLFYAVSLVPLFMLTCADWNETMGDWHQRRFGLPLY